MKKLISCMLSIALMISIVIQPNISQAKGNTVERETSVGAVQASSEMKKATSGKRVKTMKLTMYLYNGREITVPKKLAKARWVVSDKDMVTVTKGKDKKSIALDTKGKTGKCTIQAKLKGKVKYKINLTVKKRIWDKKYNGTKVKAGLINFSSRTWILAYRLYNGSNKKVGYGTVRYLQKYVNGKWQTIYTRCTGFPAITYRVPAHTSKLQYYRLSDAYDISKLTAGTYRLFVDYWEDNCNSPSAFVKFKIK